MWSSATLWLVLSAWTSIAFATSLDTKIVNGIDAKDGEFPYLISLRTLPKGQHRCGGTLYNSNWVITAAHCVSNAKANELNIQYGSNKLDPNSQNVANICKIFVHEQYNPSNQFIHDIALLKLSTPVQLGPNIDVVTLPTDLTPPKSGTSATLAGWGLDMTGGTIQTKLQKVDLMVVIDEECSALHGVTIHETNICAGVPGGGKGQCSGDSGGPLISNGNQIGLVSWSHKPCAVGEYPGVFTELVHYKPWISKTISATQECPSATFKNCLCKQFKNLWNKTPFSYISSKFN